MRDHPDDRDDAELERQVRNVFKASVDDLDTATLSRLKRARRRALAPANSRLGTAWRG